MSVEHNTAFSRVWEEPHPEVQAALSEVGHDLETLAGDKNLSSGRVWGKHDQTELCGFMRRKLQAVMLAHKVWP